MLLIITVAVSLRIWGLKWGLPNYLHYYSYHPDENVLFSAVTQIDLFNGYLDPGFYNYGSLYIYFVNIATTFAALMGWLNLNFTNLGENINQIANIYLTGRVVAVIMSLLTVFFVYVLGKKAYGRREGLLAASLMAIIPIYVMHSKFMAVDVPCTLFITLSMIFAFRLMDGCRFRDYLFAGLFAGLAAGTKYNAGLALIVPVIMHFYADKSNIMQRIINAKLFAMIAFTIIGFIIATPGILINQQQFIHDFMYEVGHVKEGHGLVFANTGSGYIYHLLHSLLPGLGLPLFIIALLGVVYAIKKHTYIDIALLAFVAVYYFVIGSAQVRFSRYIIPMLPVLALFASRFMLDLHARYSIGIGMACFAQKMWTIVIIFVIAYTLLHTASLSTMMASVDTRDSSIEWIRENIDKGSTIGLPTIPWFYTTPFDPEIALPIQSENRLQEAQGFTDYLLCVSALEEWDTDFLARESPQYVVTSEFEKVDRIRIKDPSIERYMKYLNKNYKVYKSFNDSPNIMGVKFPIFVSLPHDMSYISPEIVVYAKKGD